MTRKRLRQHDLPQHEAFPQAECGRRVPLSPRHGLDAAAYDLGDEGGGVSHERDQQRKIFRRERPAADEIEAAQFRERHGPGYAKRPGEQRGQDDHQQDSVGPNVACFSILYLQRDQLAPQQIEQDKAEHDRTDHPELSAVERDRGNDQPAIGQEDAVDRFPGAARRRQSLHQHVPDQELQQERDVAQCFDIDGRQPREQPVGRQPRDADQRAHDGRDHDADHGNPQRVDDADNEGVQIGVLRTVGQPGVGDGHAGLAAEEGKAGRDTPHRQIMHGVGPEPGNERDCNPDDRDLPQERPESLILEREAQALAGRAFARRRCRHGRKTPRRKSAVSAASFICCICWSSMQHLFHGPAAVEILAVERALQRVALAADAAAGSRPLRRRQ